MKMISTLSLTLLLIACGGGGGENGDPGGASNALNPNGLYRGNWLRGMAQTPYDTTALIYDGKIYGYSLDASEVFYGTVAMDGFDLTGPVAIIENGGPGVRSEVFDFALTENISLDGGTYVSGEIVSLNYDTAYDRAPDMGTLSGTYSWTDGANTLTVSITANGVYSGSDTDGCVYSGTVGPADGVHNIYSAALTVSSCGSFSGAYNGYLTLSDGTTANDTIDVFARSADWAIIVGLFRT